MHRVFFSCVLLIQFIDAFENVFTTLSHKAQCMIGPHVFDAKHKSVDHGNIWLDTSMAAICGL